ncbi:unnamed protein product [Ascophyllum nodosum]
MEQGAGGGEVQTVWCGCLSIRYYQQFFQVDTKDVTERWVHSVNPYKKDKNFMEVVQDNPDAYGPFWNSTSLIFLIALTTNLSGEYDLSTLVTSTWVVYGFAVVSPVALWLILNQLNIPVTLIKMICMYGYSLGPFLPAVLVCALPVPYLPFVLLVAAGVMSAIFLLRALGPSVLEKDSRAALPIMIGVGAIQAVFTLTLKFGLFVK